MVYASECVPSCLSFAHMGSVDAISENVFLLVLTAGIKIIFTAATFGMMIPAGIFLPTIAIGACLGRAMGLVV